MSLNIDLKSYFMKGLGILKLRGEVALEVSKDQKAVVPGVIFLGIGGIAVALGALIEGVVTTSGEAFFLMLFSPVLNVLLFSLFIGVFHTVARVFGGKATFQEYFRAASFASIITWTQIYPIAGMIIGLWSIPVNVMILEKVHGLRRLEAVTSIVVMMGAMVSLLFFMDML